MAKGPTPKVSQPKGSIAGKATGPKYSMEKHVPAGAPKGAAGGKKK